jgi:DNA-binding transcriptional ArsR family regulator
LIVIDLPLATSAEDALAQPTRARLFELLGELGRPAGTVELAERLSLHPNGVRVHLERLERAGLLARARAHRPRGRPRDAWTIASDARPGGHAPHAYAELARWIGLTVAGSLLHLLAVLARIRNFTLPMPQPRPLRDRTLTVTAGAGVAALALARAPGLAPLGAPAAAVTAAVGGLLAIRVLALALRAAGPPAS